MKEILEQEKEAFRQMIGFVNSKLDTIFESCGIVCQKMIETNVCGIIYCWTFESVNPRTPTQRVQIREALERMTEQLPYAGFAPHRCDDPQFRSGHSDRRPCAGGCCRRPVRCCMARRPLQKMSSKKFLCGHN